MARTKKTQPEESADFDVPMPESAPPDPVVLNHEEDEDGADEPEPNPPKSPTKESPEQRRLMRQKRVAKAEQEQLRRLCRQFPVVARLVAENHFLKDRQGTTD